MIYIPASQQNLRASTGLSNLLQQVARLAEARRGREHQESLAGLALSRQLGLPDELRKHGKQLGMDITTDVPTSPEYRQFLTQLLGQRPPPPPGRPPPDPMGRQLSSPEKMTPLPTKPPERRKPQERIVEEVANIPGKTPAEQYSNVENWVGNVIKGKGSPKSKIGTLYKAKGMLQSLDQIWGWDHAKKIDGMIGQLEGRAGGRGGAGGKVERFLDLNSGEVIMSRDYALDPKKGGRLRKGVVPITQGNILGYIKGMQEDIDEARMNLAGEEANKMQKRLDTFTGNIRNVAPDIMPLTPYAPETKKYGIGPDSVFGTEKIEKSKPVKKSRKMIVGEIISELKKNPKNMMPDGRLTLEAKQKGDRMLKERTNGGK